MSNAGLGQHVLTKPHPFLSRAVLFSGPLPVDINQHQTTQRLKDRTECTSVLFRKHPPRAGQKAGTGLFARVSFASVAEAELTLAVQNNVFTSENAKASELTLHGLAPDLAHTLHAHTPDAFPCAIELPQSTHAPPCLDALFTSLRKFGPIYSLSGEKSIGLSVRFWKETDSMAAQRETITVEGKNIVLRAYDPKVVFCTRASSTDEDVRKFFADCGEITSVEICYHKGTIAFVTFSKAEEALKAIETLDGKTMPGVSRTTRVHAYFVKKGQRGASSHGSKAESAHGIHSHPAEIPKDPAPTKTETVVPPKSSKTEGSASVCEECTPQAEWQASEQTATTCEDTRQESDDRSSMPNATLQQWDEMWRTESQRLQKENKALESEKLFIQEDRIRLESLISQSKAEKELLEEVTKLRGEQLGMQAQVDELLRQQENWLLEKAEADGLQRKLTISEGKNRDLERQLGLSESRRKILEMERLEMAEIKRKYEEEVRPNNEALHREATRRQQEETRNREEESQRETLQKEEEQAHREKLLAEERKAAQKERERAAEAARRAREEKERQERERAEEERKKREKREHQLRQKQWAKATQREEARCKTRDEERWTVSPFLPWTPQRAFERFVVLLDEFANEKFTEEKPLTFGVIPWPVLIEPERFHLGLLQWDVVESFFKAVKPLSSRPEFGALVQKVYLSFHPNRWMARRLLLSIRDEGERKALEQAGITVSQAMSSIWEDSKK